MPTFRNGRVVELVRACREATTANDKGCALEDLVEEVFTQVPGVEIAERNRLNAFRTEEVDLAIWQNQDPGGFYFMPFLFLTECKNWSSAVGSEEIAYFIRRCEDRGCDHGILIAANGITGDSATRTEANHLVSGSLRDGTRIIVITLEELESLRSTDGLVELVKRKLCQLAVAGAVFV